MGWKGCPSCVLKNECALTMREDSLYMIEFSYMIAFSRLDVESKRRNVGKMEVMKKERRDKEEMRKKKQGFQWDVNV